MQDHDSSRAASDRAVQRAVLSVALADHPESLTTDDLTREIGDRDAVSRAVTKLCEVGLLDRDGESVTASAAAVHFDRLGL
ncbi:MAG TPA: hypothetical protein VEQ41_00625 [Solirubrobacterales bacterium]|nr:hypothetical protein [Solirubrobacterales bacterium]